MAINRFGDGDLAQRFNLAGREILRVEDEHSVVNANAGRSGKSQQLTDKAASICCTQGAMNRRFGARRLFGYVFCCASVAACGSSTTNSPAVDGEGVGATGNGGTPSGDTTGAGGDRSSSSDEGGGVGEGDNSATGGRGGQGNTTTENNAFRIDDTGDVLAVGTVSQPYPVTLLCWAKLVVDRDFYSPILTLEYGPGHSVEYNELLTDVDGTTLVLYDHVHGVVATLGTMAVGSWYKVAMVIGSGKVTGYLGNEGTPGLRKTTGSIANIKSVDYSGIGSSYFATTEWFNGSLQGVRIWNAALSDSEIAAEFTSPSPVRTADILGGWLTPTVTARTVLNATVGEPLVDGYGAGLPTYSVVAGPKLDP